MTPAEQSALLRAKAARDMGGMAVFQCPRMPNVTRLRPATCADLYTRAASAKDPCDNDALRLPHCRKCPVGAANAQADAPPADMVRKVSAWAGGNLRARIIEAVSAGADTAAEVSRRLGAPRTTVGSAMAAMAAKGLILRTGEVRERDGVRRSFTYGVAA